ncbi:MAG TPA: urate hydroxylase PuuD [Dokdonella sp.]|nr:urate hydroxylase PuuD [Dokdonella sp.]
MNAYLIECCALLLRWLHVVAAIAWIGESFYFVMLDRALKPPANAATGVAGELWSVHGGGFYHKQKYLAAPASMPDELHWSKWKAYTTWLSGLALFSLLYLHSPMLYLVDPAVAALTPSQAVLAALAFPLVAWLAYDLLCRLAGFHDAWLGGLVGLLVLALCYAATHLFAGRAAFLLVGAALGTIMSANVFFVIIPGQRKMVAALARGETPDPLPGLRGRQRSVHNTYFTLPVVFAMLSIHYATATVHAHSWLVLALFMLAGALIRQFFVFWHGGRRAWSLLAAGVAVLLGTFAWLAPPVAPARPATASAPDTAAIKRILEKHCTACHSAHPGLMASAPNGVQFDDATQIERYAQLIHRQVVTLRTMPPGNVTGISEPEREEIGLWYQGHAASDP